MLNIFKKNTSATATLAEVDAKISAVQAAQAKRYDRQKALRAETDLIAVEVAAGDEAAIARSAEIDLELSQTDREIGVGAKVLAELGDARVEARQAVAAEEEAVERAARIKSAKAELKRIPAMFGELKELDARRAALHRELAAVDPRATPSAYLDAWQADMTSWLEWRAGLRERSPHDQAVYDARQERYESEQRRKTEMAWQNSPKKAELDAERYVRSGWQVHDVPSPRFNSETREWE